MVAKLSFGHVVAAVVIAAVVAGVVLYAVSGATTNKGTTGAISAENAKISAAEKVSCKRHGTYGTIATLEREGLLTFKPTYNAVVFIPGKGCGTIVVGSAAYQSQAN